jgi:hypothetical protein
MTNRDENILGQWNQPHRCEHCGEELDVPAKSCLWCNAFMVNTEIEQLKNYLRSASIAGVNEFRVAHQGNGKFIIHPLNRDGATLDFRVNKDQ